MTDESRAALESLDVEDLKRLFVQRATRAFLTVFAIGFSAGAVMATVSTLLLLAILR